MATTRELVMDRARLEARCSVLMQGMATVALWESAGCHPPRGWAKRKIAAADKAALEVKYSDLSVAGVS